MNGKWLFHVCGLSLAVFSAVLSYFSFGIDPAGSPHEIAALLWIVGGMAVCYLVASLGIALGRIRVGIAGVLVWAFVARACLFPSLPILETDPNRYLWDGYVLVHGVNPYQFAPQTILDLETAGSFTENEKIELEKLRRLAASDQRAQSILLDINNPEVVTVYPPFTQILFGVTAWFCPLSIVGWRCTILIFDALLIAALVILLPRMRRNPALVIFYAWSPLVLKEFINTLHFDVIALSLLFLGFTFALSSHAHRSAAAFACAVWTKVFPLAVFPFWMKRLSKKAWITFILAALFLTFPFMTIGSRGASGLAVFAHRWESNSSLVSLLEWILTASGIPAWGEGESIFTLLGTNFDFDAFFLAKGIAFFGFAAIWSLFVFKATRQHTISDERRMAWTFSVIGALLLCSPVCNPWYVAWVTPFLCFYPRTGWLYLSIACLLHYTVYATDPWAYPWWSRPLQYGPAFLLLLWEFRLSPFIRFRKTDSI